MWLVAGGAWLARIVQVLAQLAVVRILTDRLGAEGYGLFAVLTSLSGWLVLSDFSIGTSLQNHISERRVAEQAADDIAFTAIVLALGAAVVAGLLVFLIAPFLSYYLLDEFTGWSASSRMLTFWAMAFPMIGTALGGVAYKVWFAQHRGYLSNLLPALAAVLGLLGIWIVASLDVPERLSWTVLAYYLPGAAIPLLCLGAMAVRMMRRTEFRPTLVRPLLHRAMRFWVLGLFAAGVLQVDYAIIAQVLPAEDIVVYNVATKVFTLILFVYSALLFALWPVCSEAIARGDWDSVLDQIRKYLCFGAVLILVGGSAFALLRGSIVTILAPSLTVDVPIAVIALLTVYALVRIWTDTFAMVLQSMNDLTVFWIATPIQAVMSIALQIVGVRLFGLPGMVGGLILCFVLSVGWMLPRRSLMHARLAGLRR